MEIATLRVLAFTILPLVVAAGHIFLSGDRSRVRVVEITLFYLFAIAVAGNGFAGFFGHVFLSEMVAESIGWASGSPFQLEVGVANLALGVLGVISMTRRDGFREATVIAVTVMGVGATAVHLKDILDSGNLAPGNTIQIIGNLMRPALLIAFLIASRRLAHGKSDL